MSALLCGLLISGVHAWAAQPMICWQDDKDARHCADRVPPEHAHRALTYFDADGRVIDRRPAAPTDAERAAQARVAAERARIEAAREAQRSHDRYLLRSYAGVEDIEAERLRQLAALESRMRQCNAGLARASERLSALRSVETPSESVIEDVAHAEDQVARRTRTCQSLETQREQLHKRFDDDVSRLRALHAGSDAP